MVRWLTHISCSNHSCLSNTASTLKHLSVHKVTGVTFHLSSLATLTLCHVSNFSELWKLTLHNPQCGSSAPQHITPEHSPKSFSKLLTFFAEASGIIMYIYYSYVLHKSVRTRCWDSGQNLLPITSEDPHYVLTKAPRLAPFISFFALWLLQWALMQKCSKCGEKCLKEKFGHAWHHCTDIKVSTVNFSSPEITPAGLNLLTHCMLSTLSRCPCSYSISLIYYSGSEILNLVESMW